MTCLNACILYHSDFLLSCCSRCDTLLTKTLHTRTVEFVFTGHLETCHSSGPWMTTKEGEACSPCGPSQERQMNSLEKPSPNL